MPLQEEEDDEEEDEVVLSLSLSLSSSPLSSFGKWIAMTVTRFANGFVLRAGEFVREDLWVRDGRVVNPRDLFFEDRAQVRARREREREREREERCKLSRTQPISAPVDLTFLLFVCACLFAC